MVSQSVNVAAAVEMRVWRLSSYYGCATAMCVVTNIVVVTTAFHVVSALLQVGGLYSLHALHIISLSVQQIARSASTHDDHYAAVLTGRIASLAGSSICLSVSCGLLTQKRKGIEKHN